MPSMTQENTPVKRTNVKVIALAVICIILAASLVGVIAFYQPAAGDSDLQAQLSAKNTQIAALQSQIASLTAQQGSNSAGNVSEYILEITYLNQQLAALNSTLTEANSNVDTMTQILNLQITGQLYSDTFLQTPNTATTVWTGDWNYAGYVVVQVLSTSNTTYAQVQYTVGSTSLSFNQTVGLSGTAILPVLTGTAKINLGNTNTIDSDTINATVTYFY
jgi:hypothetical protein